MTELATRNLIAGTARLMSAVIVLLELVDRRRGRRAARAARSSTSIKPTPVPLPEWANWVALVASSLGVAIARAGAASRAFGWIVAACVVGYVGSRFGTTWLGGQLGVIVGAFALGVLAQPLRAAARSARRRSCSVPAVLLLVPGGMGFRGMSSLLDRDTLTGVETVFAMFVVAIAIVAGLLIANAVVSPRRSL